MQNKHTIPSLDGQDLNLTPWKRSFLMFFVFMVVGLLIGIGILGIYSHYTTTNKPSKPELTKNRETTPKTVKNGFKTGIKEGL